ncbi:uncharacterized protein BDR25DRAFT_253647 [Lindgomyces ingoldianus]|uniref:Uncharacterized protein n=1 Tax=Lindgomyces ingoldianus TaxID=673940 RepID=A0ACB6R9M4_9PLEO|nr:uncharacterized protein BDR25DRAFT_253647 [Lindgomyces ingoldianus]KAF2476014.1 hypothetical protein BDR25DRAFT_253647 [Lindgomyces ingoldianus]
MFKKLKDKIKREQDGQQHQFHPSNPYYMNSSNQQHLGSPSGKYQSPHVSPPAQGDSSSGYVATPGPPPPQYPQQPPPSWEPPPYHDWTVIPDNSLLPPPPSICYDSSPTANCTMEDGDRAFAWTEANPLWQPQNLTPAQHTAIQHGQLALLKAPTYTGDLLPQKRPGHWKCRTHAKCKDSSILTNLPMYSVFWDSPLHTQQPKTIYFELKVTGVGRGERTLEEAEAGIAVGFVAPPYPTFRLPGWQRASLGIHGDDGRKYVNDTWGGVDFTTTFKPGDIVGIGIKFAPPQKPPSYEPTQRARLLDIDVFFTRNGMREGGWDGNEELDARSEGGTTGLRGECDLFPAIGVFGGVDFEVFFSPEDWIYNPF